ncbi:hypothetical protein ERO13_A03G080450v2, partial [Gossypium hirsutum]
FLSLKSLKFSPKSLTFFPNIFSPNQFPSPKSLTFFPNVCCIAVDSPLLRRVNSNQKFLTAVLFAETKKF